MQKITLKLTLILFISSLFLYACGGAEEKEVTEEPTEEVVEITTDDTPEYMLPSPLQIAELFKSAGLTYIGDLTTPKENIDKLTTKHDQKLNFGVYSADMAYCLMNDQTQESINYLKTLKELSEKIWMMDIINAMGLSDRLEANVGNEDSLTYIMADMQMQMDDYLEENGMSYMGSIIFAGAWIESIYIGVEVNKSEKNEHLIAKLSEQDIILDNLIASIKQTDEDKEYANLVTDLEKINQHFDAFDEESEEEYLFTDEQIASLGEDIIALRTKIIGGE